MTTAFWDFVVGCLIGISLTVGIMVTISSNNREKAIKHGVARYNEKTGIFEYKTWPEKEENKN
jgi:hypothetical protein